MRIILTLLLFILHKNLSMVSGMLTAMRANRFSQNIPRRPLRKVGVLPGVRIFASSGSGSGSGSHAPPSDKPQFSQEGAEKYFDFDRLERQIYTWWDNEGYFSPTTINVCPDSDRDEGDSVDKKPPFVIPMPPPNVTGHLHMGHAMFVALQDIMARFHRMRGRPTLWLPGTDHAGIATQLLVERALVAEGTSRQELGREKFLQRVWLWKEEKGGYITGQMRRLGASADWTREKFTLQPEMSEAVTEAFVQLHEKGLVYRGNYLVNWSPGLQTSVSDLEVDYVEEIGTMYTFKYPLADENGGHIPVSTTRPETILGDTAVCVHPEDERYKHLIGSHVRVPMTDRTIPIIADEYVDREFGTGALKVTPAHDINDYALGKKHNLELISIMNKDATIKSSSSTYNGMDRFACRQLLWMHMKEQGLAINEEEHTQRVPRSQRGGEIIEPMVSSQWFVDTKDMAARAATAVRDGSIEIVPSRFDRTWYQWLDNIQPWCVSRQLWWGHRIPAYHVVGGQPEDYVVARSEAAAYEQARVEYGNNVVLRQDDDVLDTWFSSGLWPFATLGWPQACGIPAPTTTSAGVNGSELSRFYPASVLETGYDILFFWVARMVMLGIELTGKVPFETIYLHGLIRDGKGAKMSKTTGNVIDPLETIDKFGCDALRYSLVTGSTPGMDIPLSMERVESNRNFANKLWNAGKYLQMSLASLSKEEKAALAVAAAMSSSELESLPLAERYIISRCHQLVDSVTDSMENHNFGDAGRQIHDFLWEEFADWYLEISKTRISDKISNSGTNADSALIARRTLVYVWDRCLRLLHPFMPFLTEVLWQLIPHTGQSIMVADWPTLVTESSDCQQHHNMQPVDVTAIESFTAIQGLIRSIRNARAEYNVEPGKKIAIHAVVASARLREQLLTEKAGLALLGRLDETNFNVHSPEAFAGLGGTVAMGEAVHLVVSGGSGGKIVNGDGADDDGTGAIEAYLPLVSLLDVGKEINRLQKQARKLQKELDGLTARLTPAYLAKAPPAVVADVKRNIMEKLEQLAAIEKGLEQYMSADGTD